MESTAELEAGDGWISQAVLGAGQASFFAGLWGGLRAATGADHISLLTYDLDGNVLRANAVSWRNQPSVELAVNTYATRLFQRDPNYGLMRARSSGDAKVHVFSQSSTDILDKEYRRLMFDAPGFIGKVGLIGSCAERICYLNIYFSSGSASVSRALGVLRNHGATLTCLARRHEMLAGEEKAEPSAHEMIELTSLSARERQVVALLRQGKTAKEVAKALDIAPATVVTYKARIFEKLQVSNLREFLIDRRL